MFSEIITRPMNYYLLTGATGLLGNYLCRDLMQQGVPLAVLVRSNRRQSARMRVEQMMAEWEERLGIPLPRPVVLEGDISQPDLGLDAVSFRWAAENCSAVIHNAASLTFHSTNPEGEPWRSNIAGTQHVLDFCKQARIRELHHVSTAYIAGLRKGSVLETEVNVGQELSNDYEVSKLKAEELVRSADFLDSLTVFRPGIIIGDSRTGLTTTYHGFYAALQLAATLAQHMTPDETGLVGGQRLRLALDGSETKHLVPVEWVSAVMAHIIPRPELHDSTYHLTPNTPITTRLIRDVLEESLTCYGVSFCGVGQRPDDLTDVEAAFYDHIRVYNSYWREDPAFDTTQTRAAAPHLPCPLVDRAMLLRLSRVAIDSKFATPSKRPVEVEFDAHACFQGLVENGNRLEESSALERTLGLNVVGPGGGQWQVLTRDGQIVGAEIGLHADRALTGHVTSEALARLIQGISERQNVEVNRLVAHGHAQQGQRDNDLETDGHHNHGHNGNGHNGHRTNGTGVRGRNGDHKSGHLGNGPHSRVDQSPIRLESHNGHGTSAATGERMIAELLEQLVAPSLSR